MFLHRGKPFICAKFSVRVGTFFFFLVITKGDGRHQWWVIGVNFDLGKLNLVRISGELLLLLLLLLLLIYYYYITNMLFDSLHLLGVLLGNFIVSQQLPVAQRHSTFDNRWALPRMADNCTLPRRSGTSRFPNQVLAPFVMLPRAPITIGIIMTVKAPWIVVISNASWYFSTFSFSVLVMFWSAGTAMSISVHLCVSLYAQ